MATRKTTQQPAAQVPAQTYPPIDITATLGVPLTQRGQPDFANHVPSRFIPIEEAQARGWSRFWDGRACRYGHQASRKTTNPNACSDCERQRAGEVPLYPQSRVQEFYEKPRRAAKDETAPLLIAPPAPKAPEPDAADQKFLTQYAALRDLEAAATACGTTPAQINSRRSHNAPLDSAMSKLESNLAIPRYVPAPTDFEWTDDKRARLLEEYINSGNLAIARDAIKCTPSQLWRELDANQSFSAKLDAARVRAAQVFEEVAHAQALAGNDRLLPIVLKAERPDKYQERQRVDLYSDISRLTDEQLNARIFSLIERSPDFKLVDTDAEVIDGEIIQPAALAAPESAPEPTASNQDLA